MNKINSNQQGFTIVEALLVVAVVVIVGLVGWRFYDAQQASDPTTGQTNQSQQPPEVKSSDDLQKAEEYVSNTDIDKQLDTTKIDSTLSQ